MIPTRAQDFAAALGDAESVEAALEQVDADEQTLVIWLAAPNFMVLVDEHLDATPANLGKLAALWSLTPVTVG